MPISRPTPTTGRRRRAGAATIGVLAAALVVAQSAPALAEELDQVTTLTISSDGHEESDATLVVTLDEPIAPSEVEDAMVDLGVDPADLSIEGDTAVVVDESAETVLDRGAAGPPPGTSQTGDVSVMAGPTGQDLYCWASYAWGDSNGRFSLQHACGGSTAPWGYKISLTLRNIITGYVYEHGMRYYVNGVNMGRANPHYVPDDNNFHGTFSRTYDYTRVAYDDYFTFRVNVGGRLGDGALSIAGNFRFVR